MKFPKLFGRSEVKQSQTGAALAFSLEPVLALPDKLTACAGDDSAATLAAMGLTQVEVEL